MGMKAFELQEAEGQKANVDVIGYDLIRLSVAYPRGVPERRGI